jgi:hypothetical protein
VRGAPGTAVANLFRDIFLAGGFVVFCWGFWKNLVFWRGVFMVNYGAMCGDCGIRSDISFVVKDVTRIPDLFSGIPVLGMIPAAREVKDQLVDIGIIWRLCSRSSELTGRMVAI